MKHFPNLVGTMAKPRAVSAVLAGFLFALSPSLVQADEASTTQTFSYAVELYKSGKASAAFGRFRSLANTGNSEAAGIALFMLRNGEMLYGTAWSATPYEISQWLALTSNRSGLTQVARSE